MAEELSRRTLLVGLAAVTAGVATAALAGTAEASNPPDPDRLALQAILVDLVAVHRALARLQAGFTNPPDPDRQAFVMLLQQIETQAGDIDGIAAALQKSIGGVPVNPT